MAPHRLTSHTIETEAELRELLGEPLPIVCAKLSERLTPLTRKLIERSPFVVFGDQRLRALVTAFASIDRYLRYLGEPTELPPLSPARGPPFFTSRVLRRKLGELEGVAERQTQMFSS